MIREMIEEDNQRMRCKENKTKREKKRRREREREKEKERERVRERERKKIMESSSVISHNLTFYQTMSYHTISHRILLYLII